MIFANISNYNEGFNPFAYDFRFKFIVKAKDFVYGGKTVSTQRERKKNEIKDEKKILFVSLFLKRFTIHKFFFVVHDIVNNKSLAPAQTILRHIVHPILYHQDKGSFIPK